MPLVNGETIHPLGCTENHPPHLLQLLRAGGKRQVGQEGGPLNKPPSNRPSHVPDEEQNRSSPMRATTREFPGMGPGVDPAVSQMAN